MKLSERCAGLVQDQRSVRLEWYVIGLICIEVMLSMYELFFRQH